MSTIQYTEPVANLLTYNEPEALKHDTWPNYLEKAGIGPEHIPDLLQMLGDQGLHTTNPDETDPKYWGPVHAWRTLGQLKAAAAARALLELAPMLLEDKTGFSEWAIVELPQVYGLMGEYALPLFEQYLADSTYNEVARVNVSTGLMAVAKIHPETREDVIKILTQQLEAHEKNTPEVNGYLIATLADLQEQAALPLIERVFAARTTDESIIQLDDVLIELGLKERLPVPDFSSLFSSPASKESLPPASKRNLAPSPMPSLPSFTPIGYPDTTHAHVATPSEKYFTSPTPTTKSAKKIKQKMAKAAKKQNRRK